MKKRIILSLNLLALTSFPINSLGYTNDVKPPFIININNNGNVNKNNKKKKNKSFDEFFKKFSKERRHKETEEKKKINILKEKQIKKLKSKKQKSTAREKDNYNQEFILTFYTSLPQENSGIGKKVVTCQGKRLRDGIVANNILPLNTKIKLQGYGIVEVLDRGGKNFNNTNRLDVYIPRNTNESNSEYYKRVNSMGRVKVKGRIVE